MRTHRDVWMMRGAPGEHGQSCHDLASVGDRVLVAVSDRRHGHLRRAKTHVRFERSCGSGKRVLGNVWPRATGQLWRHATGRTRTQ